MNALIFLTILWMWPVMHEYIHYAVALWLQMKPTLQLEIRMVICRKWPTQRWKYILFLVAPVIMLQLGLLPVFAFNVHFAATLSVINTVVSVADFHSLIKVLRQPYPPKLHNCTDFINLFSYYKLNSEREEK